MKSNRLVMCPILKEEIEDIECIETVDAIEGILKEEVIPDKFKEKENWKDICRKCKWHNY